MCRVCAPQKSENKIEKKAHITYQSKTTMRITFCVIGNFVGIETFVAVGT